jgi:hypothetical protein
MHAQTKDNRRDIPDGGNLCLSHIGEEMTCFTSKQTSNFFPMDFQWVTVAPGGLDTLNILCLGTIDFETDR